MKVKCDHRSKFSNLSNWKEEAWKKNQGFNGIRTPVSRRSWVRIPLKPWFFFRLLLSNCLNWKIYCDDHTSLSSTTAVQIWIISYIFHNKESSAPYFKLLDILNIDNIFKLKISLPAHKISQTVANIPDVFQNYLVKVSIYNTRYASNLTFHVPRVRSNYGKHTFRFAITKTKIKTLKLKHLAAISSKKSKRKFWLTPKVNNVK